MKWGIWGARFNTGYYEKMIKECLSIGVTSFDHADIYGDYTTEAEFGEVLKNESSLRSKMQIITKCGIQKVSPNRPEHKIKSYDTSYDHIIQSVENSLNNLSTDYIDCLLIHRPDPLFNADEVAKAFTHLKEQGKVLHFGVSNFKRWHADLLNSRFTVEVNQVECSLLHLESFLDGTLEYCQQHHIKPMAWSPLGAGNLFAETDDERIQRISAVAGILTEKYNTSADAILYSWILTHPSGIHPVTGTTKTERIQSATEALKIKMEREDWFMLWRASTGKEVA